MIFTGCIINLEVRKFNVSIGPRTITTYPVAARDHEGVISLFGFHHCTNSFLEDTKATIELLKEEREYKERIDEFSAPGPMMRRVKKELGKSFEAKKYYTPEGYFTKVEDGWLIKQPMIPMQDKINLKIRPYLYIENIAPILLFLLGMK